MKKKKKNPQMILLLAQLPIKMSTSMYFYKSQPAGSEHQNEPIF